VSPGRAGRRFACGVAVAIGLLWASAAWAQTPASTATSPVPHGRGTEFDLGMSFLPPVSMGSPNINFTAPSGAPFAVAHTASGTGASFGLEVRIGLRVRQRMSFEMAGAWSHVSFQTSVTSDVEASPITVSIGASRFAVGGATLFRLSSRGRKEVFALATASWMREVSQLSTSGLYADGAIVDGGLGVKLWFREQGKGRVKRVGLRIEGRAGMRTGGLKLDAKSVHFTSAFIGSLIIGS
jgi:hypothetical protein